MDILNELYEPWAEDREVQVHNHFTTDAVTQYLIYRQFAETSYRTDGFVGWNPLIFGGIPAYANTMALYDDWTMQLHRFLDFWTAWHLGYIGQFLVAGLGMFVFLRSQRILPTVALVGAIVFALNSNFILWMFHRWQLSAFAWVPWLVWAMYRYRNGSSWAWPLVPVFLGLAFLGGNLQTSAFVAIVLFGLWFAWLFEQTHFAAALRTTGLFALWSILGLGLASFAIYPSVLAYLDNLSAGHLRGAVGYGDRNPILMALLIPAQAFPTLLGSPRSVDLAKLLDHTLFDVAYFGVFPMLIAYRCALFGGAPLAARLLMFLGLFVPLTPLLGPLYYRVQIIFVFGGIWAFAYFWQNSSTEEIDRVLKWVLYAFLLFAALWLMASVALLVWERPLIDAAQRAVSQRLDDGVGVFSVFRNWTMSRAALLISELRIWHPRQIVPLTTVLVCFAALWLRVRHGLGLATLLLSAGLTIETGAYAVGWVTISDLNKQPFFDETRDISNLRRLAGDGRVYVADDPGRPRLLWPNTLSMFEIADIDAYESIHPPSMWQLTGFATDAGRLGSLAVTYQVTYPDRRPFDDAWEPAYRGEKFSIWRNLRALPRYLAVSAADRGWMERFAARPDNAFDNVILAGSVIVREATANYRKLQVPAATSVLRIAENWSEEWEYRIDADPWRSVERGPDMSMLAPMEGLSEAQTVELRYRPQRRIVGWWISLAALIGVALATWQVRRKDSNSRSQNFIREWHRYCVRRNIAYS